MGPSSGGTVTDAEILAEVKACAEGALSWIEGYTDPFPDGYQRRVVALASDGKPGLLYGFDAQQHPWERPRIFRIKIDVEEVPLGD